MKLEPEPGSDPSSKGKGKLSSAEGDGRGGHAQAKDVLVYFLRKLAAPMAKDRAIALRALTTVLGAGVCMRVCRVCVMRTCVCNFSECIILRRVRSDAGV